MTDEGLYAELSVVLTEPPGQTSRGFPYLTRPVWERLRDWVPHALGAGPKVLRAVDRIEAERGPAVASAAQVVRQVVRTAAITAPSDLWLLRHVFAALASTGWAARLEQGCEVPPALGPDATLLLGRGYLVRARQGFRWADEPTARRAWTSLGPLPAARPFDLSRRWARAFGGEEDAALAEVYQVPVGEGAHCAPAWVATPEDLELGYRLVPLVLGMRAAGLTSAAIASGRLDPALERLPVELARAATETLSAAGWSEGTALTELGKRSLERGPGPFGIIEAYHPYLAQLPRIWEGQGAAHVERAANVAASQDANRATFLRANDQLDAFCADTGFRYRVFVEHAVGRGEALRQRFERSGADLAYVGADLEDAAIAAAREEVAAGRLPADVLFVRADIADPGSLVRALRERGLDPEGAVMLVGNGFHEVRDRSDARMVEVFAGYERAGIVLSLTEECALSVEDLLHTAWNTYHAGFRYVHERSGQGLRPASPTPATGLEPPLPASWVECATRAGYVRLERYGGRSRTIYPYQRADGHNPSVSANLFFVPARLWSRLER